MSETSTNVPGMDDAIDDHAGMDDAIDDHEGMEDALEEEDVVSPKARAWINALTGLSEKSAQTKVLVEKHAEALESIDAALDRDEIKAAMSYSVNQVPDTLWKTFKGKIGMLDTLKSMDEGGDAMKEIDTWHDLPGTEGLPAEQVANILDVFSKILKTAEDLEANPAYQMRGEGDEMVPDFVKIGNDVWQPLVREGIIPENVVPDKYSEVARTFKGAAEAYDARLLDYSENLSNGAAIMAKAKPFFNVTEGLLKAGSAGLSVAANATAAQEGVDGIQQSAAARDLMKPKTIVDTTLLCVVTCRMVGEKLVEDDLYSVADVLNACLKGVLVQAGFKEEANVICNLITVASRTPKLADKLAHGDIAGALEAIGDGVAAGISANNSDNATIGSAINAGFKGLAAIAVGVQEKDPQAALNKALAAAKKAGEIAGGEVLKAKRTAEIDAVKADGSLSDEEKQAQEDFLKGYYSTTPKGTAELQAAGQQALALGLKPKIIEATEEELAQMAEDKAAYDKAQQEAMLTFLSEPDPDFERMLVNGFSDIPDGDDDSPEAELARMDEQANSIENLIAMVKKDQMTFDLAKNICEGGTGLVASFLPAAGIVAVGTKLMFAMLEAAKHAEQLTIWAENLEDARSAKTVQADAILNRYSLQSVQTIRANIVFALRAVDLIGQVVKTAGGPAAPAGAAISAAAQGAEGLMDVALTVKTEVEMANAWSTYKKAIATPQDRKLARRAMQKNPTLAKYAMAYGALKEKHPVAVKAMSRCGLNAKTLADERTNMDKVVTYLETIYRDDPVLLRPVLVPKEWHPGTPELDVISWTKFYTKATTSKKISPKVAAADISKINATMAGYQAALTPVAGKLDPSYVAVADDDVDEVRALLAAAMALSSALGRYKPVDAKDGKPHAEMRDYLVELDGLAKTAISEAEATIDRIEAAQEAAAALIEIAAGDEDGMEDAPDVEMSAGEEDGMQDARPAVGV